MRILCNLALHEAVRRAQCLPVFSGTMNLKVDVLFAVPSPGPGEDNWSKEPAGDPSRRILLQVRARIAEDRWTKIDEFYANEGGEEVRPCTAHGPVWW